MHGAKVVNSWSIDPVTCFISMNIWACVIPPVILFSATLARFALNILFSQ